MLTRIFTRRLPELPERGLDELKPKTNILFVDDDEFRVVEILKNNGWQNTQLVNDIDNLDELRVRESHIIFIDIHGVGAALGFEDEGLGLMAALKSRYPEKRVIVYSAESVGDRFNENLTKGDARVRKNADPIKFLDLVEGYSQEMFSASRCIERLEVRLREEFGVELEQQEIHKMVAKLAKKRDLSDAAVAEMFNIDRAGAIASMLSLLLSS